MVQAFSEEKNLQKTKEMLKELEDEKVIVMNSTTLEAIESKRVKKVIVDYKIRFIPTDDLISDIIYSNKKAKEVKLIAQYRG